MKNDTNYDRITIVPRKEKEIEKDLKKIADENKISVSKLGEMILENFIKNKDMFVINKESSVTLKQQVWNP